MPSSTLTSKGQVTLPAEFRRKLGLKPGQRISFELQEDGIIRLDTRSWVERTKGMLAGRVPPTDDMQQRIRDEKRAAEEYSAEIQMEKLRRAQ